MVQLVSVWGERTSPKCRAPCVTLSAVWTGHVYRLLTLVYLPTNACWRWTPIIRSLVRSFN